MRRTLGIDAYQVQQNMIRNTTMREMPQVSNIADFIVKRQLSWIELPAASHIKERDEIEKHHQRMQTALCMDRQKQTGGQTH